MRKIDRVTEGEWMLISHAEDTLGLTRGALGHWLKRHGHWNKWTRKRGKYRIISIAALERYEEATAREGVERVNARPAGWVGVYKAADLIEGSVCTVWKAVKHGRIRAVRHGHINWYHPGDCRAYRLELHDYPLPGWTEVKAAAENEGADPSTVTRWLKRNGHQVRKHRRPSDKQVTNYTTEASIAAWRDYYLRGRRARSLSGQKLTLEQAADIRQRRARGEKRNALAQEYGVSEAAIYQIAEGITYKDAA